MEVTLHVERTDLEDGAFELAGNVERWAAPPDSLDRAHFVDPISAAVVVSAAALAERIITHWLRSREQGVQIDLTQDPPNVSAIANVPRGYVVVIDRGGVETHKLDYDGQQNLSETLERVLKAVAE